MIRKKIWIWAVGALIVLLIVLLFVQCRKNGGNDNGGSRPAAIAAQTPTDYDDVIAEIRGLTQKQRCLLEGAHYCLEIAALIDKTAYPDEKLDRFELERQFRRIASEDYNFRNLEDETVRLLKDVVERIKDLRISEGDRALLDELYVREKRSAWMRVLPQNMAVLVSADWKQVVANAAQTLIYSAFNYLKIRSEIEIRHKKESWELDKKVIEDETKHIQRKITDLYEICKNNDIKVVDQDIGPLLKKFNGIERIIDAGGIADENWKEFNDHRQTYRSPDNIARYKMYSTYWRQRGYLAWLAYKRDKNENDRREARECFGVYQELTRCQIVKYNPAAIDVAMMQIDLQREPKEAERGFLQEQLRIVRDNLSPKSLDGQSVLLFCGQIYYLALKDYDNAADMFKRAEEIGNRKREKEIEKFCVCLKKGKETGKRSTGENHTAGGFFVKDGDGNEHFLPALDVEFFTRMAYCSSRIEAGKDMDYLPLPLVVEISRGAKNQYISPWEYLFFAAYVKEAPTKRKYYEEILPTVLLDRQKYDCNAYFKTHHDWASHPVGEMPLPYELKYLRYMKPWLEKNRFSLKMPYQYALLGGISSSMHLLSGGTEAGTIQCAREVIEKDKDNRVFLRLDFPLDEKVLREKKIDRIRFDFKYKSLFESSIAFDFGDDLSKSTKDKGKKYYEGHPGFITFHILETGKLKTESLIGTGVRK